MAEIYETELKRFAAALFSARGMAPGHAALSADALVWANLRGVDTHGVVRLTRYMEIIDEGLMNMTPALSVDVASPSGLKIASDRAPGPVAMNYALDALLPVARQQGIAAAFVSQMTHTGALGYYTLKAAEAGFACIALNSSIPLMPYHGAGRSSAGTNPLSFAAPAGDGADPFLFDMATSVVSLGQLMLARRNGTPLEPGLFVDADANPTTDAAVATMPLPLGGPKGSGLSLMIEVFTSLLCGHPIVAGALTKTGEGSKHRQNALLIAIDIGKFVDPSFFRSEMMRLSGALKSMPLAPGSEAILMPGERGFATMKKRRAGGIPLPPGVLKALNGLAERYGIAPPQLRAGV